jgi:hypothetical protein
VAVRVACALVGDGTEMGRKETEFYYKGWIRLAQLEGSYEHGNKHSGSVKDWRIPEHLIEWRLLEKDPVH